MTDFVMGVLARERNGLTQLGADAQEIVDFILERCAAIAESTAIPGHAIGEPLAFSIATKIREG